MKHKARRIRDVGMLKKQPWFQELQECVSQGMESKAICAKYDISPQLLSAYIRQTAARELAKEVVTDQRKGAAMYADRLEVLQAYCQKVIDACDEWLTDPDRPERYTMDPRAEDLKVVYTVTEEDESGKPRKVRKHADLSYLLDELYRYGRIEPQTVSYKATDPRKLILDALSLAQSNIESIAKIMGYVQDIQVSVDVQGVIVPTIVNIMLDATVDAPIVRQRLMDKMEELSSSLRTGGVA